MTLLKVCKAILARQRHGDGIAISTNNPAPCITLTQDELLALHQAVAELEQKGVDNV